MRGFSLSGQSLRNSRTRTKPNEASRPVGLYPLRKGIALHFARGEGLMPRKRSLRSLPPGRKRSQGLLAPTRSAPKGAFRVMVRKFVKIEGTCFGMIFNLYCTYSTISKNLTKPFHFSLGLSYCYFLQIDQILMGQAHT